MGFIPFIAYACIEINIWHFVHFENFQIKSTDLTLNVRDFVRIIFAAYGVIIMFYKLIIILYVSLSDTHHCLGATQMWHILHDQRHHASINEINKRGNGNGMIVLQLEFAPFGNIIIFYFIAVHMVLMIWMRLFLASN